MPPPQPRRGRQVAVDVQEGRARDVRLEGERAAARGVGDIPAAVDELVAQGYQLPSGDGGSGTEAGWIT